MRNLKVLITVLISSFALNSSNAQSALAFVDAPIDRILADLPLENEEVRIDRAGILEISEYISNHVEYPFDEFRFLSEMSVTVQISLNVFGDVIEYHVVDASNETVSESVTKSLINLKKVTPILINGLPKAQTIQIPVIFKSN